MLNKITDFIARHQLLSHQDGKYIVALSGGADSVALLLVLQQLQYDVEAAHCNFRLRGEESDRDEQFVRKLCSDRSVPLHVIHFDTIAYAELHKVSIEMAARQLRYHYFEQLRQDIGAADICVAHHRDDAVETLLMNLLRGTGIHGLTGIRPRNGHLVRPLLCVTRTEIVNYLDSVHQPYVTDSSNLVPDVVRNRIRLEVLPLLQQINPAAAANIARTAHQLAEAEKVYNAALAPHLSADVTEIRMAELLSQPSPESLLFELLTPRGFSSSQVEQVYNSLNAPSGRTFLSPTHELAVDRNRLVLEGRRPPFPLFTIPEAGLYRLPDGRQFRVELLSEVVVSRAPGCATLDAAAVQFPLTLRTLEAGDRFQPFGMRGSRLVSDYLTDLKRTVLEKRRQLVLLDAHDAIVWLVGERVDQRFAVGADTRSIVRLTLSD